MYRVEQDMPIVPDHIAKVCIARSLVFFLFLLCVLFLTMLTFDAYRILPWHWLFVFELSAQIFPSNLMSFLTSNVVDVFLFLFIVFVV